MDTNHVLKKIVNFFWKKKCTYCNKIKLFKKLYICSCQMVCHKSCHMKSMEKTEDIVAAAAQCSVIKHDEIIGHKGDGLDKYEVDINENDLDEKNCETTTDNLQDCYSNKDDLVCNEEEEIEVLSQLCINDNTKISSEKSLNAKLFADKYWKAYFPVHPEENDVKWNKVEDGIQCWSQVRVNDDTKVSSQKLDDSEDNSAEFLNDFFSALQNKDDLECNGKEEIEILSQVCVNGNTKISSAKAEDTEDNSAEYLNDFFSVLHNKDDLVYNEEEEIEVLSRLCINDKTKISSEKSLNAKLFADKYWKAYFPVHPEEDDLVYNEEEEIEVLSRLCINDKTKISSEKSLNAKLFADKYWKAYFPVHPEEDDLEFNGEEEIEILSQVCVNGNTKISSAKAEDTEDNSAEYLNDFFSVLHNKNDVKWNKVEDGIQCWSQVRVNDDTKVSSQKLDDSEDNSAEFLNDFFSALQNK